jgi:hypothetical protein
MPIPQRKKGQTQDDFISSCIGDLVGAGEYEQSQAAAICYQQMDVQLGLDSTWRKSFLNRPESTCLTQYRQPDIDQVRSDVKLK